jgi:hypothetical protein
MTCQDNIVLRRLAARSGCSDFRLAIAGWKQKYEGTVATRVVH